jgi:RNA ligase
MSSVIINHVDDVLPHITDLPEIRHTVKDGYSVIDYNFETADTFMSPITQQCRGLKFDETGRIIGRPLHKFFNYGQKLLPYDWLMPHKIMLKLDGSMVHTCIIRGELRLCTRMGTTEHAQAAEALLTSAQRDALYAAELSGLTVIMEYTSPYNRIVIAYDTPELTVLAARDRITGEYVHGFNLLPYFKSVQTFDIIINDSSVAGLREYTTGIEGYVVSWADGTYVKIKAEEYVRYHRAFSFFDRPSMILPMVLSGNCDDIYPLLANVHAEKLRSFEQAVLTEVQGMIDTVEQFYAANRDLDRKSYALKVNNEVEIHLRAACFLDLKGSEIKDIISRGIINHPEVLSVKW